MPKLEYKKAFLTINVNKKLHHEVVSLAVSAKMELYCVIYSENYKK